MYLLILLGLVVLILLYFVIDNLNLILNLFSIDVHNRKPSDGNKTKKLNSKNLKKHEKQSPPVNMDKKVEIIQRSSNNMVVQQQTEVRVLTLQDNQHQDGVHYRLKIGWTLELCLGESLFGRRVVVFCNIPEEGNSFQRTQYRTLEWANNGSDDTANYIRVPITQAGSFHYYFTFEGSSEKQGSGYIVVEPSLSLGAFLFYKTRKLFPIVRASEDTGIEITEAPETSDRPHQTPVQTAPVKKTFIRPVIKIDRCGDNENVEPPPITPIDNMYTGDDEKTNETTPTTPVDQRSSNNMVVQQQTEVRVLTLQDNQHQDGVHYRLKIGWTLELFLLIHQNSNDPNESSNNMVVQQQTEVRVLTLQDNQHQDGVHYRLKIGETLIMIYVLVISQELGGSNSCYSLSSQLDLNPLFSTPEHKLSWDDVIAFTEKMRTEWQMLSLCDIVLNHTANETHWLQEHPEASYNLVNSPHLKPAYLLDVMLQQLSDEIESGKWEMNGVPSLINKITSLVMLQQLSDEIESGKWEMNGVPSLINNEDHLNALRHLLHTQKLPQVRIPELYTLDIELLVKQFQDQCRTSVPVDRNATTQPPLEPLRIIQDAQYRRLKSTVDLQLALNTYNVYRSDCFDEDSRIRRCVQEFKLKIDELNNAKLHEIQQHLNAAVENFIAGSDCFDEDSRIRRCVQEFKLKIDELNNAKLHEIQQHLNAAVENFIAGVRYYRVSHDGPRHKEISLKCPLVYRYFTDYQNNTNIDLLQDLGPGAATFVMAHNGWVMGADPLQNFAAPESNVYLRRELIAWGDSVKLRFGSSPADNPWLWAHMKSYVEITARAFDGVRLDNCHSTPLPVAEYLLDAARAVRPNLYVVAELFTDSPDKDNIFVNKLGITSLIREAMSAWDSHELGRIVYRYGGEPIGAFLRPSVRPLVPGIAHALLLDLSHDNPCPITKRCVFDLLPSAALVSMAACASGSNTGYDTLVPHHIDVVQETRQYPEWDRDVTLASGIIAGKRTLNRLHSELGLQGYTQVFVDQVDPDIVAVTRHHPNSHESVLLVAFTSFSAMTSQHRGGGEGKGVTVSGHVTGVVLEAGLRHKSGDRFQSPDLSHFTRDSHMINGLTEYTLDLTENIQPSQVSMLRITPLPDGSSRLDFTSNFKPGCVVAVRISPIDSAKSALSKLSLVFDFSHNVTSLSLADLNKVLYCCGQEDGGTYNIPGYGHLVYCGLQDGFCSVATCVTLFPISPGLPHFSTGYMRNWGRDTFIALRGLFLLTGRYQEARFIILGFAGTLRHGLIPNLLDGGYKARYNCRDAVWWWLYTLQCYVREAPNGIAILQDKVNRLYPEDDDEATSVDQLLYEVVQEAVERHFQGVVFRERNAGTAIDAHMVSQGFDNQIGVHPVTGFVFGGNQWNCGTWMDKMGSSQRAGNKGRPATPRDGTAVELVGLSKATVRWLAEMNKQGDYPYSGVSRTCADGTRILWTFEEWNDKIQANFERHFWIPLAGALSPDETRPDLVNRRGIYKDSYQAAQDWPDYQLRCNYPIAMVVVSSDLFSFLKRFNYTDSRSFAQIPLDYIR
ncbi:glycogen debranching enzyme [Diaphorina citri]|uniref:Glycogen debranching enzyme n=1 Tax=Diaphorina citri TaxID=121845 RepID=A0A3Q0ILW2_DIACI|nr:glycogen debranching enzyme [Diaphorina citri]